MYPMRSRTTSASVLTSNPSTCAEPPLSGNKTRQHLDYCSLAAAVRSKKPENLALLDTKAHVIHCSDLAKSPNEMLGENGGFDRILHGEATR